MVATCKTNEFDLVYLNLVIFNSVLKRLSLGNKDTYFIIYVLHKPIL